MAHRGRPHPRPRHWLGTWIDSNGKAVTIESDGQALTVTVRPGVGLAPYTSATLLDGGTKAIERLEAACHLDAKRGRFLEVETGTAEIGPTYRLYAAIDSPTGWRAADVDVLVDQLVLIPNTIIGLYDDFDDDLGVPWAYPLLPLRRQPATLNTNQPQDVRQGSHTEKTSCKRSTLSRNALLDEIAAGDLDPEFDAISRGT
jgi:hypothetical protein